MNRIRNDETNNTKVDAVDDEWDKFSGFAHYDEFSKSWLKEAKRVLKKNGSIYISTYIWSDRAELITDLVHFHHFRQYELLSALEELNFSQLSSTIYESPKGDTHRHGLYLKACKA